MNHRLYPLTAALLIVHEIDSAYWREWALLGLPGGEPLFLVAHLPLVAAVLWGYGRLAAGARAGAVLSLALAVAGLAAGAIHGAFLAAGRPEFRAPTSLAVLIAAAALSAVQLPLAVRALRPAAARGAGAPP